MPSDPSSQDAIDSPPIRYAVAPGTVLADLVGAGALRVNSTHHQAVRDAGQGVLGQGAALAAMFVASAVTFYLGIPASKDIQKQVKPLRITITQPPASGRARTGFRPQNVSLIDTAGANQSPEPTPVKPDVHISAATQNGPARFAAKRAAAADGARVQALLEPAKTSPITQSAGGDSSKKWSVQISAAPAEDIADTLVQRLKASGYDGYVVRAEVKGQTYYRVRVGHFDAREEAELVRQSLTRQEGYRGAYLTGD